MTKLTVLSNPTAILVSKIVPQIPCIYDGSTLVFFYDDIATLDKRTAAWVRDSAPYEHFTVTTEVEV